MYILLFGIILTLFFDSPTREPAHTRLTALMSLVPRFSQFAFEGNRLGTRAPSTRIHSPSKKIASALIVLRIVFVRPGRQNCMNCISKHFYILKVLMTWNLWGSSKDNTNLLQVYWKRLVLGSQNIAFTPFARCLTSPCSISISR